MGNAKGSGTSSGISNLYKFTKTTPKKKSKTTANPPLLQQMPYQPRKGNKI